MWKFPAFALTLILAGPCAQAQSRSDCQVYARDYAAVVAPRTGASTLRSVTNGHPTEPGMGATRSQPGQSTEWSTMVPHQNAYQRAFEDCMARGQR